MADYTDQDINGLLPGEPWTSAKAIAAFENPIAIAQGAPGSPVITGRAATPRSQQSRLPVLTLSASNVYTLDDMHYSGEFTNTYSVTSSTFVSAGVITSVLMSGEVRLSALIYPSGSASGQAQLLKNGIVLQTFATQSVAFSNIIDVSISVGDTFEWQVRRVSGAGTINLASFLIKADDAYTRIGIPIKESEL